MEQSKNIYRLLPAILTMVSLSSSVLAVTLLPLGLERESFMAVIVALFCDMIDGPIAIKLNSTSKSGIYLDSVADMFIYLFFPSIFWMQSYDLSTYVIFIFVFAGTFRLTRFSSTGVVANGSRSYYVGMPVYYSHLLLLASFVNFINSTYLLLVLVFGASVLMISKIKFIKLSASVLAGGLFFYIIILAEKFYGM